MQSSIRPHDRFALRIDRIGREGAPVVQIDNFVHNADELVADACAQAPFHPVGSFYPGLRSAVPMPYPLAVYQFLKGVIADIFGLPGLDVVDSRCNFCLITKRAAEVGVRQRIPHCDSPDLNVIVVLHYLFDRPFGGTSFYRHRRTGFEMVTAERKPTYETSLADELRQGEPDHYIAGDSPHFERIAAYEPAYNRALIYRSASLHTADVGADFTYDADPRRGRLTANCSFLFGPQAVISLARR
jgi:hypothetical protein